MRREGNEGARAFAMACVAAVAIVVGANANSFQNSFHFDDSHVVEGNLYIRSLTNIPLFFRDASTSSSQPANAIYRPLVTTTLALDYWRAGGLEVRQFHQSQLAMLVVLGTMVFFLLLRLLQLARDHPWNRAVALVGAALFSVHTTNTETMNLIHARSELLSTGGIVGSFLVYLFVPRSRRAHLYLFPMIVGALAKAPAVMFAPLLFVYVFLFEERLSVADLFAAQIWPRLRAALSKSAPALVAGVIVFAFVHFMNAPTVDYGGGSRFEYLLTQSFAWLHYGRLFFLPVGLTADSDWTLIADWYDTRVVAGVLFVALLLGLLAKWSANEPLRPAAFGIAWFCLALLPASSIFPLAEVTNGHRAFFAYVGLSLAVVSALAVLAQQRADRLPRARSAIRSAACVVAVLVVGGNAVGTYVRNAVWRSEETLWRDVVEKSPANGRGLMNYGLTQMAKGNYKEAKELFDRALLYTPNYATLEVNLGIVTERLGQSAAAEAHFTRALRLRPDYPAAHFFYAGWLLRRGRSDEAILYLERALRLSPGDVGVRNLLLDAYANAGRTTELRALAEDTLRLVPVDAKAAHYLNRRGALAPADPAAAPRPAGADEMLNVSLRLYQGGDFQGSLDAARQVLAIKPDSAEAYNNIAASYASLGKYDEAITAAREALRLKPDFRLAANNLAWAEAEKKKQKGSK
jgi:tetratricopeptide (TPR) repeat protein